MALGGKNGSDAGMGGRAFGADVSPGLEVVERIDDAPTDLSVFWPRAVGAVLFQRPARPPQKSARPRACGESAAANRPADRAFEGLRDLLARHRPRWRAKRSRWRSGAGKGDADDEGVLAIPQSERERSLRFATRQAQQFAIAAVHQFQPRFYEADGPIAQVVRLPGPFGNAFRPQQTFGDCAIGGAVDSGVERAQRQQEPLFALRRKPTERGPA